MRMTTCILAVAVLASWANPTRAEESIPPDVLKAIKKATVFVKVKVPDGEFNGSGFVVKADGDAIYVVSNHHVIEPKVVNVVMGWVPGPSRPTVPHGPSGRAPYARPYLPSPNTGYDLAPRVIVRKFKTTEVSVVFQSGTPQEQTVPAAVVAADPDVDLALLKVKGVKDPPAPIQCGDEHALAETMPVFIFGFPLGRIMATSGASPAITVGKASVSSLRQDDAGELAIVQIDGAINHGNSGGPIVDASGKLVGVAVAFMKDSTNIGLAIPCHELPRMLAGRLGRPNLRVVTDEKMGEAIQVEVGLIDPLHHVRGATLYFMAEEKLPKGLKPTDHLKGLPGCHQVQLKIEDQVATGKILFKATGGSLTMCCEASCSNDAGPECFTARTKSTLKRQEKPEVAWLDGQEPKTPPSSGAGPKTPPAERPNVVRPPKVTHRSPSHDKPALTTDGSALAAELRSGSHSRIVKALQTLVRNKPQAPNPAVSMALADLMLKSDNAVFRAHSAWALENWATPESLPALQKAAQGSDRGIQHHAQRAIERLRSR